MISNRYTAPLSRSLCSPHLPLSSTRHNLQAPAPMSDDNCTFEISDTTALPETPLVSVYMLTYRHERFIADAIEGVIAQRCDFPIELIIGEDCSPDRTREIVLDYQLRYPRLIRVITSAANVGARDNSVRSRAACRGKYIAICEGDDYWTSPDKLAKQVDFLESELGASLVCHAVNKVDAQTGQTTRVHRAARRSRYLSSFEVISGDGDFIATCSILVRRSLYENRPKWWEQAPIGDYPLVLRAAQVGKIAYLDQVMGSYRVNVPGSWNDVQKKITSIEGRYAHASAMKQLLLGYNLDIGNKYLLPIHHVIRRYLFDAIVGGAGPVDLKRRLLNTEAPFLTGYDRMIGHIALASGRKFTKARVASWNTYRWLCSMARDLTGTDSIV